MSKQYHLISLFLLILISCNEKTFVSSRGSLDWDFLPLEVGQSSIYRVQTVDYLGRNITPEMKEFFMKEEIVSEQIFQDGTTVFTILESKMDTNGGWVPIKYSTIRAEFDKAVSNIENLITVELMFPLLDGNIWSARQNLNSCPDGEILCDSFEVTDRDKFFETEGKNYPATVRIVRQNTVDPLQITMDHTEFSIYAQGVGLVYSERKILEYASCRNGQNVDCCCPENILCTACSGEIEFGAIQIKSLIEQKIAN